MGERRVVSAEVAVEIVKEYARSTMRLLFWKDVVECRYDENTDEGHVVYEASPGLIFPYYRYEAVVSGKDGRIKWVKRSETGRSG